MSKRVLCKFFAHGECLKGEHCQFSHDWEAPSYNVCAFYQKGTCSYGSRCRYEHVKLNRSESATSSSSSSSSQRSHLGPNHSARSARTGSYKARTVQGASLELSASSAPFVPNNKPAWIPNARQHGPAEKSVAFEIGNVKLVDLPLCLLAADGCCPNGNTCFQVHGDLCPTCGKLCLHPFRPEERDEHLKSCEKKQKYLETLKHSQEIECSVCLDRVLSKPSAAERKFGVLSECDHPFCISCIRNWRNSSPASGVDANTAVRACPVCRKVSYFVVPSVIWYTSKEEKQEIVDKYKAKLRSIDCKHFNFGNGNCPFGNSCFYKHTVTPGSYVWKYHRPPPRRRPAHRFNVVDLIDMDELCDLFDHLLDGDLDFFDPEDYEDSDDFGIEYLLMRSGLGLGNSSDEEDSLL